MEEQRKEPEQKQEPLCFLSASMKDFSSHSFTLGACKLQSMGPDPGFVNKVLLVQSHTHSFTYCLPQFLTVVAE